MKFTDLLNEEQATHTELLSHLKKMGSSPVMYRGHNLKFSHGANKIKNDRKDLAFKGKILDTTHGKMQAILKGIGILKPVFVTTAPAKASVFGQVYVVIPKGKWNVKYSEEVKDLTDVTKNKKTAAALIDTYKDGIKKKYDELVLDTKEYFLLSPSFFLNLSPKWVQEKFNLVKGFREGSDAYRKRVFKELDTYKKVYEMIKAYDSYYKWRKSQ